jgi:hypothetical protein
MKIIFLLLQTILLASSPLAHGAEGGEAKQKITPSVPDYLNLIHLSDLHLDLRYYLADDTIDNIYENASKNAASANAKTPSDSEQADHAIPKGTPYSNATWKEHFERQRRRLKIFFNSFNLTAPEFTSDGQWNPQRKDSSLELIDATISKIYKDV